MTVIWLVYFFCFHCRVDKLLNELKNDTTLNYVIFFKGFKSIEIDIFFSDIEHFIDFETPMSNKWLDFVFIHTFV